MNIWKLFYTQFIVANAPNLSKWHNYTIQVALIIIGLFICEFANSQFKMVKNGNFLVKNGLFISEFKIRGPKWRDVSTANNEGNLYLQH